MKTRLILFVLAMALGGSLFMGLIDADPVRGSLGIAITVVAGVAGMKDSKTLKEEKGQIWERAQNLVQTAKAEKRSLSDDENKQYDQFLQDMRDLDIQIKRAEESERRSLEMAGSFVNKENEKREQKEVRKYSFIKAINARAEGRQLEGFEAEMHQEAVREARENGLSITGIGIPNIVIAGQKRDINVGTDGDGGYTVPDKMQSFIDVLRPKLLVSQLGAQLLTGLTGDVPIPRKLTSASGTWEGETDANAESSQTFDQPKLSPTRLGTFTTVSKQLLVQSSLDIEKMVREDLAMAIKIAVDLAAINGSGSGQPTGILNTSGIGSVAGGTNGAAPTYANLVNLEREVAVDDADVGKLAFLTNPKVRAKLKQTVLDSGSGLFIWPADSKLLGYETGVSTQVPGTLVKGDSGAVCSAIIFGNWNDLIIGQWGGLDLVVDPYTGSKNAQVNIVINSWWDILLRHPASFAAMVDALTS